MTYVVLPVAYSDVPGLTETIIRGINEGQHYNLLLNGATTEELISEVRLRLPYNLSNNRSLLRT